MALWKASELCFRSCLRRTDLKRLRSLRRYLNGSSPKTSKIPQAFAEGEEGGGETEEPKPLRSLRYLKGASWLRRYLKEASKPRRPDGSVGMALVLPALTDCRWWFESLLVHSGVSSATRRKATGADQKKKGLRSIKASRLSTNAWASESG